MSKNCASLRVPNNMNSTLFGGGHHRQPYGYLGDEEPAGYLASWTWGDSIIIMFKMQVEVLGHNC